MNDWRSINEPLVRHDGSRHTAGNRSIAAVGRLQAKAEA